MGVCRFQLPDYFRYQDLSVDDEGVVVFMANAYPVNKDDECEDEVKVGLVDGQIKLVGVHLDRHLALVKFQKRIKDQQPGWYHWDQIEELILTRGVYSDGDLHYRVIVKKGSTPYARPTGLVNYFLNVSERGTAVYHADATDEQHREIKAEFDEFKQALLKEHS